MRRSKARSTSDSPGEGPPGRAGFHAHGWTMFFHPALSAQLDKLIATAEAEQERHPGVPSAASKLLGAVVRLIFDEVPKNPMRPEFRLGRTLGDGRKHWFRVKFGGGRFRLFFRYRADVKLIVYGWMNDENTLRTYGSRSDAYTVFGRMLDAGNPPDEWDLLLATASSPDAAARASRLGASLKNDG